MRNLSLFLLRRRRRLLMLLPLMLLLVQTIQTAAADSESSNGVNISQPAVQFQWQILTKTNYSTEIRRHPHILLMITVPWCGESRSLKKELVNAIMSKPERFGTLKLMLVYRNTERMLANASGASERITILYIHHSVSYKYGGRLRVQNLLSSIHSVMSLLPGELPLKFLNTPDQLRNFFDSTDKALLFMEVCGWTPRLLAKGLIEDTNGTQVLEEKKQKTIEDNKMSCNVPDGFSGFPSFGDFILGNDGALPEAENMTFGDGFPCTLDEFQRLESFFPKFIKLARDFFLPPERLRFGVVSEKSLLSELVNNASSAPWLMKLYSAGCPSCSKILGEDDDLKIALETQDFIVKELRDDVHDVPTFPANRPSVLLFIDRSSESLPILKKSKEALSVFRKFALHYQDSNQKCGRNTSKSQKSSYETLQTLSPSKASSSELFSSLRKLDLNDKMSVMIMNNGRQISLENFVSDLQGGSLHEVLANLLQDKNKSKLSSLAKDAGFELLSDDFEIKGTDDLLGQPEHLPDQVSGLSPEGDLKGVANLDEDSKLQSSGTYTLMTDEETKPTGTGSLLPVDENHPSENNEESSENFINFHANEVVGYSQDRKFEDDRLAGVREQIQQKNCSVSFFFCDGDFRLLKGLTGANSTIPSLVILDPVQQKHFILPESDGFSLSVLSDFLDGFLKGSLLPYQQSHPVVQSPREVPNPPFVNLDFHEVESIPRVTVDRFAEMVIGNESDSKSGDVWVTDVLVLFTGGWCGFCQRMEMVVREAFRAIKGYANMLKMGPRRDNFLTSEDNMEVPMKLPLIYLMDCTLNDCSLMLKSTVQREMYPSLLLFPAGQKNAIIYEGDVAVYDVIKFLSDHGALVNEKGVSWPGVDEGGRLSGNVPIHQSSYYEVLLKDQIKEMVATQNSGHPLRGLDESRPQILVGSILTASDKLTNGHPFDESKILIVKVDQARGFEGLILNKHIHWESLEELNENLQMMMEAPLSYGGPVMKHGMLLVALARKPENEQHLEVLPDVHFLDQWATLRLMEEFKLGNKSVHGYWFFLGFSSWGWEQLFHEIAEGAWDVSKGTTEQLDWPDDS